MRPLSSYSPDLIGDALRVQGAVMTVIEVEEPRMRTAARRRTRWTGSRSPWRREVFGFLGPTDPECRPRRGSSPVCFAGTRGARMCWDGRRRGGAETTTSTSVSGSSCPRTFPARRAGEHGRVRRALPRLGRRAGCIAGPGRPRVGGRPVGGGTSPGLALADAVEVGVTRQGSLVRQCHRFLVDVAVSRRRPCPRDPCVRPWPGQRPRPDVPAW